MSKQYIIVIFICAFVILCNVAAKYSLINVQNQKIVRLQKDIAAARISHAQKTKTKALPKTNGQDDINKIIQKIPQKFSFTQYAAKISTLMDINNLSSEKNLIFIPEKIDNSDLLKYNTNIVVTGDYKRIKKFIADILNLSGLAYFNTINFARDKDNQDKVKFKFELSVFFTRGAV